MPHQDLFKTIFQKTNLQQEDYSSLLDESKKYPYFSIPYYFLLKNIDQKNNDYATIAGKTAMHFNNPYLLHLRLNETKKNEPVKEEKKFNSETTEQELIFEPLYTSDYFASQGIKLSEEQQSADKLGKQLKSFTEWLKTMKKTNGSKLPEHSETEDLSIQNLAEKSNKEANVVTESMAEVYIQHGKTQKAIEIYRKLSLQNPSKNTYFAEKIESIKVK